MEATSSIPYGPQLSPSWVKVGPNWAPVGPNWGPVGNAALGNNQPVRYGDVLHGVFKRPRLNSIYSVDLVVFGGPLFYFTTHITSGGRTSEVLGSKRFQKIPFTVRNFKCSHPSFYFINFIYIYILFISKE